MSIVFKVPLTPDEINFFDQQFTALDKENLNIVTGDSVKPLFSASGLSSQLLSQIWSLVDLNNKGFLNKLEFYAALRCIGQLQINNNLPITEQLYESPSPVLPRLGSNNTNISTNTNITNTNNASSSHVDLPLPTNTEIQQFGQLFDRTGQGEPTLSGLKARDIFLKAKLNNQVLGEIWALCDRNANGNLERPEFIMAMYLIQLKRNNNPQLDHLLQQHQPLPQSLWNVVSMPVQAINSGSQLSSMSPVAMPAQLSANSTGMSLNRQSTITRISSGVFSNASDDWTLSFEKKKQFDVIFDSLDKQHAGSLSSQVLVPFFLSSKLSQETLASIWDLADIHNNASFTKIEFAIAMFLIQKKNQGTELPDVIPNELLQSQALGLYNQQPQQIPQVHANTTGAATIPSRSTKPVFQDTSSTSLPAPQVHQPLQMQSSNNGSLNDLMQLNGTFSSPTLKSATQQPQPQSPQLKKFTPTSNFGQNIIQEEGESLAPLPNIQHKQAPAPPVQRTASVSLPQVPNFSGMGTTNTAINAGISSISGAVGAVGAGSTFKNNDLYADADASAKLSAATTDLANLSNQVTSISKQASITNEKKVQASKELERVTALKKNIQEKLRTLRTTHQQNVQQTEEIQKQLLSVTKENETLQNELSVVEANFHAIQNNLNEQNQNLLSSQQKSAQLKEQIAQFNSQTATLNQQLEEKQQQVKKERSLVDVNAKQLELSQITVTNLTNEISGLDERLKQFLAKQTELDQYKTSVEQKHAELQKRYEEITNMENDLNERQIQLDDRNKQMEEQEKLYHEHVDQLQAMFDQLTERKKALEKADEELKRQNIEYANNVQELAEKQMKLAMGEIPEDAMKNVSNVKNRSHQEDIDKYVDGTVANSQLKNVADADVNDDIETKTDKTESDVFDKDIPQTISQSEEGERNDVIDENEGINDNFEGDLNEYGIPRTQSFTSSVANNAPQSVRDDVELPAVDETRANTNETNKAVETNDVPIPGQWEQTGTVEDSTPIESDTSIQKSPEPTTLGTDNVKDAGDDTEEETIQPGTIEPTSTEVDSVANEADVTNERLEEAIEAISLSNDRTVQPPIDEEFPPIQELDVNESDSSSDGEFEDTKDVISPKSNPERYDTPATTETPVQIDAPTSFDNSERISSPVVIPDDENVSATAPTSTVKDEFDDEFADLQEAAAEEDDSNQQVDDTVVTPDINEPFTNVEGPVASNRNEVTNDEWDEIFAGFGNGKQPQQLDNLTPMDSQVDSSKAAAATPAAVLAAPQPPVNRAIATTPRALAVEELSGMGFTKEEATNALKECGWDLDAATNYLLDRA